MTTPDFAYSAAIAHRFPTAHAAVLAVTGLANTVAPPGLGDAVWAIQIEAATSLTDTPPAERPSIKAWRAVFSAMGVKPTQHRNAAEALLRRLQRHGDIPSINPAVDLGNAISVRHSLPVAVFDLDAAPFTVVTAAGDETFTGIGAANVEHPEPGEVIFVDVNGQVAARRWCCKQAAAAATTPDTTSVLYVIEAVHDHAAAATAAAGDELERLIHQHFPDATVHRFATSTTNETLRPGQAQ